MLEKCHRTGSTLCSNCRNASSAMPHVTRYTHQLSHTVAISDTGIHLVKRTIYSAYVVEAVNGRRSLKFELKDNEIFSNELNKKDYLPAYNLWSSLSCSWPRLPTADTSWDVSSTRLSCFKDRSLCSLPWSIGVIDSSAG